MSERVGMARRQAENGGHTPLPAKARGERRQGWDARTAPLAPLLAAPWLTLIGLRRLWRPLALVGVGVIVAVLVICLAPLYTTIIGDAQIQYTLHTSPSNLVNVEADATTNWITAATTNPASAQLQSLERHDIGAYMSGQWEYLSTTFLMRLTQMNGKNPYTVDPTLPNNFRMAPYVFDYTAALPHMNILAGRTPQETAAGALPEVMVTSKLGAKLGQTIQLQVIGSPQAQVTGRVVGVWFPKNVNDPFWNGANFDTAVGGGTGISGNAPPSGSTPTFPMLFARSVFLSVFNFSTAIQFDQPIGVIIHDIFFTNPLSVTSANLSAAQRGLAAFHNDLNGNLLGSDGVQQVAITPGLTSIIDALQRQAALLALPLDVVAGQIAGLALLFIAAMTAQLIEGQSGEIATLKSRGASGGQILSMYVTQGVALGIIAVIVGPILAAALSIFLVNALTPITSAANGVSAAYLARSATPQSVLIPAAIGALASVVAMALATLSAARFDILAFRRAQGRDSVPFWRRYYLDLALVVLCVVGYVELGQFGGLNVRAQLGLTTSLGPDPLQLITPGLLLVAGALVALRLFPLVARLGGWLATRGRGAIGQLTFAQVARASSRFTRLTLTLTLGVGLGLFALTFQTSLARNASDRAAYVVGGDERVTFADYVQGQGLPYPLAPLFGREPGVTATTPIYRAGAVITNSDQSTTNVDVLAIDPQTFVQTAYWRADYASQSLSALLSTLTRHQLTQPDIPTDQLGAAGKPIYVLVDQTFATTQHLHVGDRFVMKPVEGDFSFGYQVGAIINDFPTMYDDTAGGYIIANIKDYFNALTSEGLLGASPSEYWLRTTPSAAAAAQRARDYLGVNFSFVSGATNRRQVLTQYLSDPLTSGMTSLLLVGAFTAALLSALGSVAQMTLAARRRATNFAILRTLGVSGRQITAVLLGEQLFMYVFGLVVGTALGLLLSTATLPLLQYSSATIDPLTLGVPPFVVALNLPGSAIFYLALCLAFALSLALGVWLAISGGLGAALRLGEA